MSNGRSSCTPTCPRTRRTSACGGRSNTSCGSTQTIPTPPGTSAWRRSRIPPTEEVFTTPDPERTEGTVTSTKPLVLRDGTIIRGLRVRFEGGSAVEVEADEGGAALRSQLDVDAEARRLGELALVDNEGRIGPLGTIFYDTLLDENAASHLAFGSGFPFLVGDEHASRVNESDTHLDFMIGSPELDVDGITLDGERVSILRGGSWQI